MNILQIGPHKVQHGDVTKGIDNLMGNDRAWAMYSDPPWGEGNIKYWATMNKKMTGAINTPASLEAFLGAVFGIASKYVDAYLLIEYGCNWAGMIQNRAKTSGFDGHGIIKLIYRAGSSMLPLDLHLFARPGLPMPDMSEATNTHGYDTLKKVIPKIVKKGSILLDPCCGMGYTAQAAIDNGMIFRGNELNRKRLQKTIDRLMRSQKQ